jgi:hypothetical protein
MTQDRLSGEERRRVKQRLLEVLATELQGVSAAALGGWRKHGSVPHHRRFLLAQQAAELGLALDLPADFENWAKAGTR